jgi:hypothetical protein
MGGLDGIVNAAGILRMKLIEDISFEEQDMLLRVNVGGVANMIRAALPHLQASGSGTIVNFASYGAYRPGFGLSIYGATKAGVIAMAKSLINDIGPKVRINTICPGVIQTPMNQPRIDSGHLSQGPDGSDQPAWPLRPARGSRRGGAVPHRTGKLVHVQRRARGVRRPAQLTSTRCKDRDAGWPHRNSETCSPRAGPHFVMTEVQPGVIGPEGPWPPLVEAANRVNLVAQLRPKIAAAARVAGAPVFHCTADALPGGFGVEPQHPPYRLRAQEGRGRQGEHARPAPRPSPKPGRTATSYMPRFNGLSCMHGTALDQVLRNEGITTVVLSRRLACLRRAEHLDRHGRPGLSARHRTVDAVAGFPEEYAKAVLDNTLMMLGTLTTTDAVVEAWQNAAA